MEQINAELKDAEALIGKDEAIQDDVMMKSELSDTNPETINWVTPEF